MNDISELAARERGRRAAGEQGERLSRCVLWEYQRQFFDRRGVAAWSQRIVPSYITNNPSIAAAYARVVLGWLRDWRAAGNNSSSPPGSVRSLDPASRFTSWNSAPAAVASAIIS
jgi:hypothetical protein